MKKEIKVTKEQFERLIESVHAEKFGKESEKNEDENYNTYTPAYGAAEGLANIVNGLKKAYNYITNPEVRKEFKKHLEALGTAAAQALASEGKETKKPVVKEEKQVKK